MPSASERETVAPLATAGQVAWYLNITSTRVYEACRAGLIPHVRIGRSIRFSRAEITAWVERGGTPHPGGWRREPVQ